MNYDYGPGNTSCEADRKIHLKAHYSSKQPGSETCPQLFQSSHALTLHFINIKLTTTLPPTIITLLRILAKNALPSSCPSVRPSANTSAAANWQISSKIFTGYFYKSPSRRSKYGQNRTKISDTLHKDLKYELWLAATYVVNSPQKHCYTTLDIFILFSD
jgi:hypothetical protein